VADAPEKKTGPNGPPEKPAPAGYYEGETMTRRAVFTIGGQAAGIAAITLVALPTIGFALAPVFDEPEETWEGIGPLDDFSPDTYSQAVITIVDAIGEAGKTTVYVRQGNPEINPDESPDVYIAISTRCAHLGCPVRFVQAASTFICPCHGGVYDFEGQVIGGPPVRPLDRFQTRVVDGQVEIGPRYSVTSDLEPVRSRDPGEFTGGIWEYLYPPRPTTAPPPSG
jgi:menaquinol-cytochrome c reductase iron-sulfur subunit